MMIATFQGSAEPCIDAVAKALTGIVGKPKRRMNHVGTLAVCKTLTAFGAVMFVPVLMHFVPFGSISESRHVFVTTGRVVPTRGLTFESPAVALY
jgi:GrpB-like predicted nucleotidyltransferase (UPF0157 family)